MQLCDHISEHIDVSRALGLDWEPSVSTNLRVCFPFEPVFISLTNALGNPRPDLPNAEVTEGEQEASASRMGLASSARVSAKTGQGVDKAFERLILRVYEVEHGRGEQAAPPTEAPPRGIVLADSKPPVSQENSDCC